mmetsp:Transcript_35957/g.87315  ORF Transcript_35957/g.87315 Transcript_35957/m.87315 type:complete len:101 (-) Transcript_35957:798-1100(-)
MKHHDALSKGPEPFVWRAQASQCRSLLHIEADSAFHSYYLPTAGIHAAHGRQLESMLHTARSCVDKIGVPPTLGVDQSSVMRTHYASFLARLAISERKQL